MHGHMMHACPDLRVWCNMQKVCMRWDMERLDEELQLVGAAIYHLSTLVKHHLVPPKDADEFLQLAQYLSNRRMTMRKGQGKSWPVVNWLVVLLVVAVATAIGRWDLAAWLLVGPFFPYEPQPS